MPHLSPTRHPWLRFAVSLLLLSSSSALGAPPSPCFGPGEQSTYQVKYLGLSAGVAQITVGASAMQWNRPVWPIVTTAKSDPGLSFYPVKDRFVSYWDTESQQTVGNDLFADENRKRRRQRIVFDHGAGTAQVTKQKEGEDAQEHQVEVSPGSRDITAVTFALRNEELAVGKTFTYPIYTGAKQFDFVARVEGTEMQDTVLGRREVFKLRIQTAFSGKLQSKRDLVAYLTTDPLHVPVRIEAEFVLGTLVAELTNYHAGRQLALR